MKLLITIIGIMFSVGVLAQDSANNNVFIEAGGPIGLYSVNYERILQNDSNVIFAVRIGLAYDINSPINSTSIIVPLSFSLLKKMRNNHYLELRLALRNEYSNSIHARSQGSGMGDTTMTFITYDEVVHDFTIYPSIGIGYRYQPQSKGLFFNCLVQVLAIQPNAEDLWRNKFNVGVGYAF